MRRLVFNPRAYAFINTQHSGIIDVSDYIIRGSVNRRLNAASTASLTLQNPEMLFTKESSQGGIRITPMDAITIYLERKAGYPIRTFTGYVDTAPYYQLLPGPVDIEATCTLKKLLHIYFDPALQYTQQFLASYGWIQTADGTLFSPSGQDSTGAPAASAVTPGSGFAAATATAASISNKNYAYSWGGGHEAAGTPSKHPATSSGGPIVLGFDCSGYTCAILAAAGWGFKTGGPVIASGGFSDWGVAGVGKELTVWYNDDHVFIEFMNGTGPHGALYADTSGNGGKSGPHLRYETRSTDGFTPRHWEGH